MTEKKENRADDIVNAAIQEFMDKGYELSSMESIAKRANLSKGGLYHHFKSKVEILLAVNQKFVQPVQELLAQVEVTDSLEDGIRLYIDSYLKYWSLHKCELSLYLLTMNESFNNPQIMELYKEITNKLFDFFGNIFKKGQETGVFKKGDSYARAVSLISCLDGFLAYLIIEPELSVDAISKEIQNTFINNLLVSQMV